MMRELPTFRGYTVDLRLEEFRWACRKCHDIEFVPFRSEQGDALLVQLLSFYEAGGTLYAIEYLSEEMKVVPVPLSQLEAAIC